MSVALLWHVLEVIWDVLFDMAHFCFKHPIFSSDSSFLPPNLFFASDAINAASSFPSVFSDSSDYLAVESGSKVKYSYSMSSFSRTERVYFLFQYSMNLFYISIKVGILPSQVRNELWTLQASHSDQEVNVNSVHCEKFYFCRSCIRRYRYRRCHFLCASSTLHQPRVLFFS